MAVQPTAPAAVNGNITITGHATDSTLIFDATEVIGTSYYWEVEIENLDAGAGNFLFIGFGAITQAVPAVGFRLGIYTETSTNHRWKGAVPPHTKIYANCTAAGTRDVRITATPVLN